ncbi:class I SAM-dependent methyltransferase [Labilibacter marinus]|uniref:class I SAM-dependent methyltransferase n=1 Tax=Labilibacter marinus TaxID=1477105 RepID=UPI0018E9EDF3|nr:class I SAM-dependent methyltransferase [Labilibacter marinus]
MDYIKINQNLWDKRTDIHVESDFYNVGEFKEGKDSLNSIEIELLGDIKGKKILHLQCHFGMDTLSLARRGAEVTGVDLSSKAISKACELNEELGLSAKFIQSDIYQLPEVLDEQFDIVFTSYGTIGWLPDMKKWADVVAKFLKPGGQFLIVEFHPVVWMFSYDFKKVEYGYFNTGAIVEELEGTYTDAKDEIKEKEVSWNHGLCEVQDALIKSGLTLRDLKEFDYSPYNCFENTIELASNQFQIKGMEGKIPMVYSIVATK